MISLEDILDGLVVLANILICCWLVHYPIGEIRKVVYGTRDKNMDK